MPQYLAPGVYVEEVPGTPPIAGVGTSTAAFIGVVDPAAKNPDGSGSTCRSSRVGPPIRPIPPPTIAMSWRRKVRWRWSPTGISSRPSSAISMANRTLAHAVYGFFNNGGTTCYVTRVERP